MEFAYPAHAIGTPLAGRFSIARRTHVKHDVCCHVVGDESRKELVVDGKPVGKRFRPVEIKETGVSLGRPA